MTEKIESLPSKAKRRSPARDRILEAAVRCYARGDVFVVTARMLADEAGVALGLINYYFPNSKDIFWSCIRYIYDNAGPAIRKELEGLSDEEMIKGVIKANFNYFIVKKPEYYRCILLSYYLACSDKEIQKLHQDLYEDVIHKLGKIIQRGKVRKNEKSAHDLAMSIWNEMEGGLLFSSFIRGRTLSTWISNQNRSLDHKSSILW